MLCELKNSQLVLESRKPGANVFRLIEIGLPIIFENANLSDTQLAMLEIYPYSIKQEIIEICEKTKLALREKWSYLKNAHITDFQLKLWKVVSLFDPNISSQIPFDELQIIPQFLEKLSVPELRAECESYNR